MSGIERVCLSTNSSCNLACTYCYFHLAPERLPPRAPLSREEIGTILDRIEEYGHRPEVDKPVKVNFVGSGEPLLEWPSIRDAVRDLRQRRPDHGVRFYTVTNGHLLTREVVREMRSIDLFPSVSLDGPEPVHDATRRSRSGRGSHAATMRGIEALRAEGVPVAVNITLTRDVIARLEAVFDFVEEQGFTKLIFGQLVDVPDEQAVSVAEFYGALRRIAEIHSERGLDHVEIGNLEAYRRALAGSPDRVCTMFGSTCGAGFHNVIYMQQDVYPCGRMFGLERWRLGSFDEPLERFPKRMAELVGRSVAPDVAEPDAGPDCLLEHERSDYDPGLRAGFVRWLSSRYPS